MLDSLAATAGRLRDGNAEALNYSPDQAVLGFNYHQGVDDQRVTVIFPPWHMPKFAKSRLIGNITGTGPSVLYCDINPLVLQPNVKQVRQSFQVIAEAASDKVLEIEEQFRAIDLLGISLGNVALCLTAERLVAFNDVTMVVPGCDLANPLWYGQRTRHVRNGLIKQGVVLEQLEESWSELAPDSHLDQFKDHNVAITLARKDRFIPYKYGKKLLDNMLAINPNTTSKTTNHGHVATVLDFRVD